MKILSSEQIREADAYTIKYEPIVSIDLMERAAKNLFNRISELIGQKQLIRIFVGPGNNGGDGLVIARLMAEAGYKIEVYLVHFTKNFSADFLINQTRLAEQNKIEAIAISKKEDLPVINNDDVIIDSIFGSGLSRPLDGLPADTVQHMNNSFAMIISIDMPSGLFGESNKDNNKDAIVKADVTLTLQFPKLSLLYPENEEFVGHWEIIPIGLHHDFINKIEVQNTLITNDLIKDKIKIRPKFSHKGNYGHALLISGSYGKMGAAVLAAESCLRSGAGLLTVHVPEKGYNIIQTAVPEAMVSIDDDDEVFSVLNDINDFDAIGIGPGIGIDSKSQKALKDLIKKTETRIVFDADAINILADNKSCLDEIPAGCIFTPHPKEFERLVGVSSDNYSRNQMQLDFSRKYNAIVILKGANSCITNPDGMCWFNTTGNPGMATAGSGDVLTGIILSLLAQGYGSTDAALIGVYLHGLAADIEVSYIGEEALIARDITNNLGNAFQSTKEL